MRLAQVMTGPRASSRPVAGDQTRKWSSAIGIAQSRERLERALAVEPGGRDEAGDRPAGDVFDQRPAAPIRAARFGSGQAEEFAFAGGHESGAQPVGGARVPRVVAMEIAVEEHLEPASAQARRRRAKGEPGTIGASPQWFGTTSIAMRSPTCGRKQVEQPVDLALEARRDVVDRGEHRRPADIACLCTLRADRRTPRP